MSTGVVVVGAGIVGTATAFELARRGAVVTLVDRAGISEGTTGLGEGNVLCADKDAGPELGLAVAGIAMFDEIEGLVGRAAKIRRKGALVVHADARTWAVEPARAERLREAGVDARILDPDEVTALEPRLTGTIQGATYVPTDLQCDPQAVARALCELAVEHGAVMRTGTAVTAIEPGKGVRLEDGALLPAHTVVLAAGPWSQPLAASAGLRLPVEPRKGQLTRLRLPQPDPQFLRHKIVDASYLRALTSTNPSRQTSTIVETTADGHVVVGSSRERVGFDDHVDRDLANEMQRRAADLVPDVATLEADASWVGFRPWLPDHLPAVGPSKVAPGLWVDTGHEGAGVVLGPISGRLLAQGLCGEQPSLDLTPFDPDRFCRSL